MKNNSIVFFSLLLFFLLSALNNFGQRSFDKPRIRSSVISFSEIKKYDLEHRDTLRKSIGNDYEEEENEVLPQNEVSGTENVLEDPFGKINPVIPPQNITPNVPEINFSGIDDNHSSIPPDVNGAVGPNHIMTTLNTEVRIQSLTGVEISTVSLYSFWSSLGSPNPFDPKILYEPYNNRWIFTSVANSYSSTSSLLIAVSQTNDPTGFWNLYSVDADGTDQNWLDFPSLGYNKDWIVVTGHMFPISGGSFVNSQVYVFKKADLYAHAVSPQFTRLVSSEAGLCPAVTYDNSISALFILQKYNSNVSGNGYMKLSAITGAIGSETLSSGLLISTPNPWSSSAPVENFAPQAGSGFRIAVNDDRVLSTVYRNGSIWGAHTVFLPAGGATRSAVQWWQVSTSGAVLQRGRIDDATNVDYFGFPSIAVNSGNDALIGYSKFSSSIYASGCYVFRKSTDPINTFQSEYLFKSGQAPYYKTYSGTRNRWGDYSATMVDPGGIDFWTIQEYAMTPDFDDRWGTWWAKVPATPCSVNQVSVTITANPGAVLCYGSGVTFTATPTNPGNAPSYQWSKNGTIVGNSSPIYSDNAIITGDQISCILTSNITCASGSPATSNIITMTVNAIEDYNGCTTDVCNTANGTVSHPPIPMSDGNACTTDVCTTILNTLTLTMTGASGLPLSWTSQSPGLPDFDHAYINVNGFPSGSQITDLSVTVNLAHTWGGELQLYLENPAQDNYVGLGRDPTHSHLLYGSNLGNGPSLPYTFTSTGSPMNILGNTSTSNPVLSPGPYLPADDNGTPITFALFNGIDPNGIWTIYIGDGFSNNGGTVELFSLKITAKNSAGVITHLPINFNDGNICTIDACNTSSGVITHNSIANDGNACTIDDCNTSTGNITNTPKVVDDGNPCTTDACNTSTGFVTHVSVPVTDGNGCTIDACNSTTGIISHTPKVIDDGNACTNDVCFTVTGTVTHAAYPLSDGNACTTDACNTITGISHTQVNMNDGNACTTDGCISSSGVITHTAININDGNECTTDECNTLSGTITHSQVVIDDGNICTTDGCNSVTGVFHNPVTEICGNGIDDDCDGFTDENCGGVSLSLKLYIQGFYTGGGFMDNNGAGGSLYVIGAVGASSSDVDTVIISAMDPSPPHNEVEHQKGILKTNGDVSVAFSSAVVPGQSYFIKVDHRNTLATWSKVPVLFTGNTTYDFTSSSSQAFDDGFNMPMKLVDPGKWALFNGDINGDGGVDSQDMSIEENYSNSGLFGYYDSDLNGDGGSDSLDMTIIEDNGNAGVFEAHP